MSSRNNKGGGGGGGGGGGNWGDLDGKQELLGQASYHLSRAFFRSLGKGAITADGLVSELFAESLPSVITDDPLSRDAIEGAIRGSLPRLQSIVENKRKQWEGVEGEEKRAGLVSDQMLNVLKEAYRSQLKELADKRPLVDASSARRLLPRRHQRWEEYLAYLKDPTDADVDAKKEKTPVQREEEKGKLKDRRKAIIKEMHILHVKQETFENMLDLDDTGDRRAALGALIKTKDKPATQSFIENTTGIKFEDIKKDPQAALAKFSKGDFGKELRQYQAQADAGTRAAEVLAEIDRIQDLPGSHASFAGTGGFEPMTWADFEPVRVPWYRRLWSWLNNLIGRRI